MLRGEGWSIGRIAGIDIRIDPTWTFIAFLVGYSFYVILDEEFPGSSATGLAILAAAMSGLFFVSVLLHELAHAVVAVSRGIEVRGITLFLFGGATHAKLEASRPRDEFVIAAVGPVSSLVIAGVLWAVVVLVGDALPDEVAFAVGRLGWLNLALGVFNLVPGFPLDGGRLLRAGVWLRTGNLIRATRVASRAGQAFGYFLIGIGVLEVLVGGLVGGLWFAAIGWFLSQAAQVSYRRLEMNRILSGVEAGDMTTKEIVEIPGDTTLLRAVDDYFMRYDYNAFPIEDRGRSVGILSLRAIRKIPSAEWPKRTALQTMEPLSAECTAAIDDPMDEVVEKLETAASQRVLVLDEDEVVGILTPRDLARWLQRARELDLRPSRD